MCLFAARVVPAPLPRPLASSASAGGGGRGGIRQGCRIYLYYDQEEVGRKRWIAEAKEMSSGKLFAGSQRLYSLLVKVKFKF